MKIQSEIEVVDDLRNALEREKSIVFAYLFGSHARQEQTDLSDIDIAIYTVNPMDLNDRLGIIQRLSKATAMENIDITFLNSLENLILLCRIIEEGIVLVDRDPDSRDYFEVMSHHKYLDFRYQRELFLGA